MMFEELIQAVGAKSFARENERFSELIRQGRDPNERQIKSGTLDDWVRRLESAAHQAYDEQIRDLESDLLDLRDEIRRLV